MDAQFQIVDENGIVIDEAETLEEAEEIAAGLNGSFTPTEALYRIVPEHRPRKQ